MKVPLVSWLGFVRFLEWYTKPLYYFPSNEKNIEFVYLLNSEYSTPRPVELREVLFFFYFLAKTQRRKEIVVARDHFRRPLRLGGFARPILFFILAKTPRRKEIVAAQYDFRRPLRLPYFARYYFLLFFSQRPAPQNCGKSYFFSIVSQRRRGAKKL